MRPFAQALDYLARLSRELDTLLWNLDTLPRGHACTFKDPAEERAAYEALLCMPHI